MMSMEYFAPTLWVFVIVLFAWGVHYLWSGIIKPEVFNALLLPGTLAAQAGRAFALLATGATIGRATFFTDDEPGNPTVGSDRPKIPVIGPTLVALLPIGACVTGLYFAVQKLGQPVLGEMQLNVIGPTLPSTVSGVWQLLRDQITLVELAVGVIQQADFGQWETWLFLYLLVCLTTQLAPYSSNVRGSLGAVIFTGVCGTIWFSLAEEADQLVADCWFYVNLIAATLLFVLMVSMVIRCLVMIVSAFRDHETNGRTAAATAA